MMGLRTPLGVEPRTTVSAIACLFLAIAFVSEALFTHNREPVDLPAFYCAGEAANARANPYLEMPLFACERRVSAHPIFKSNVVVPAPLPPYGIAAYALVARLPFDLCFRLHIIGSIAALAIVGFLLSARTRISPLAIFGASLVVSGPSIHNGQPIAFLLLALVIAGYGLRAGRDRIAALAGTVLMIEPHIGIAVCASLFFARPKTRLTFAASAVALIGLSLATMDAPTILQYFTAVLPAHAASEAGFTNQFSLTNVLVVLGLSPHVAIEIATVQYALMLVLGIVIARRCAAENVCLLAFVPTLFVVIGGSYLHLTQLAFALPAAFAMLDRSRTQLLAPFLLVAMTIDWSGWNLSWMALIASTTGSFLVLVLLTKNSRFAALVTAVLFAMTFNAERLNAANATSKFDFALDPTQLAEVSWTAFLTHFQPPEDVMLAAMLYKIPNWSALVFFAAVAIEIARSRRVRFETARSNAL